MKTIITFHRCDEDFNEEYFFSTDHCQPNLGNDWIPVSRYNTTREIVKEREKKYPIKRCISVEIPNPNPKYQA